MLYLPWRAVAILALIALLGACNKQADNGGAETGQVAAPADTAATAAADADPQDAPAVSAGPVELIGCPVQGLWLPEGSKIIGTDDQLPKGWTVSFDTPSSWPTLVEQMEGQFKAKGWTLDQSAPADGAVLKYNSPDSIHTAVLINAFPDLSGKAKTTEEVRMLAQVEKARQVNPDFAFGIYLKLK